MTARGAWPIHRTFRWKGHQIVAAQRSRETKAARAGPVPAPWEKLIPGAKAVGGDRGLALRSWRALEDVQRGDYSELILLLREERPIVPQVRELLIGLLERAYAASWHHSRRFSLPMLRHIRIQFIIMTDPKAKGKSPGWAVAKLAKTYGCSMSTIRDIIAKRKTFA